MIEDHLILGITKKNDRFATVHFEKNRLVLPIDLIYETGIRKGDQLTEELYQQLLFKDTYYRIRESALRLLARRAHSVFELKRKLIAKKHPPEQVKTVLEDLLSVGILDDAKFASSFIEEKIAEGKSGTAKIKNALLAKGVARHIIDQYLESTVSPEEQYETAMTVGKRKLKVLLSRNMPEQKVLQSLYSFLLGRGFSHELIRDVTKELLEETGPDLNT